MLTSGSHASRECARASPIPRRSIGVSEAAAAALRGGMVCARRSAQTTVNAAVSSVSPADFSSMYSGLEVRQLRICGHARASSRRRDDCVRLGPVEAGGCATCVPPVAVLWSCEKEGGSFYAANGREGHWDTPAPKVVKGSGFRVPPSAARLAPASLQIDQKAPPPDSRYNGGWSRWPAGSTARVWAAASSAGRRASRSGSSAVHAVYGRGRTGGTTSSQRSAVTAR